MTTLISVAGKSVLLVAQTVKNLRAVQETQVRSLGQEDPLAKETSTHSNIFFPLQYSCLENSTDRGAWGATVTGSQRVGLD